MARKASTTKTATASRSNRGRKVAKYLLDMEEDEFVRKEFFNFKNIKLTPSQLEFKDKIVNNIVSIGVGPAGSSKTFTSCFAALELLKSGQFQKIIVTKPIQESGEQLGFLPGELDEKISVYAFSFWDTFEQLIGPTDAGHLRQSGQIEFRPLAYMRGSTMRNTIMILDEAQNVDFRQLMLYITRMGDKSKVIITGDVSQHDIKLDEVGLLHFTKMLDGSIFGDMPSVKEVGVHHFTKDDVVRHPMLIEITDRYEKLKAEGKLPKNKKF